MEKGYQGSVGCPYEGRTGAELGIIFGLENQGIVPRATLVKGGAHVQKSRIDRCGSHFLAVVGCGAEQERAPEEDARVPKRPR